MNVLSDTWRGLVQRRLWPVALLLLAAAAAVPFLLASEEEAVPVPSVTAPAPADEGAAQPIVAVASNTAREIGRDVLGSRKDPFRPAIPEKKGKPLQVAESTGSATPAGDSGSGGSGGGSTGTSGEPTTTPPPTTGGGVQVAPRKRYEVATIAVRFGESSGGREVRDLRRLKALPSVVEPVAIYLGLTDDNRSAVFMIDAGTVVQGDGTCRPSPQNCQTVQLRVGDTIFLDAANEEGQVTQYQLDFVKVRREKVASAAAARRHRLAEAAGGRMVLRERWNLMGRWRFDKEKGQVRQIGDRAYSAAVARAARRGEAS